MHRIIALLIFLLSLLVCTTPCLAGPGLIAIGHFTHTFFGQQAMPMDGAGTSLATGDFDGDGLEEFAIGVPFRDVDGVENMGMVFVSYRQGTTFQALPMPFGAEPFLNFGEAMAASDINDDGYDDLVVGAPGYPGPSQRGAYLLYMGSEDGLVLDGLASPPRSSSATACCTSMASKTAPSPRGMPPCLESTRPRDKLRPSREVL